MVRQKYVKVMALLLSAVTLLGATPALAASSSSAHYQVNETFFGSGGAVNVCSTTYCSNQSLGELSVGNPSSPNYQAHAGFNTTAQPYLYFTVNASSTNLGVLSTTTTEVATGTFSVRTYQAGGYIVQTASQPPTNGEGHTLSTPSSPTAPAVGTEQFGMNLVANSCPPAAPATGSGSCSGSLGANPVLNPVSGPAVGIAASNYNQAGKYMYNAGDTIASSTTPGDTTGEADYMVSYIFNIGIGTPAGQYTFNDVLVATATY